MKWICNHCGADEITVHAVVDLNTDRVIDTEGDYVCTACKKPCHPIVEPEEEE